MEFGRKFMECDGAVSPLVQLRSPSSDLFVQASQALLNVLNIAVNSKLIGHEVVVMAKADVG